MASRSLGTLTLDLIAKIGGFTAPLDQASRDLDKRTKAMERRAYQFGQSIGKSMKSAAGHFLAFAGVSLTVGAAFESLKGAIDLADETRDLSIRLGISTEAVSDFRYAAQQTGTDMETLAKGIKKLSTFAVQATNPLTQQAKIFRAMGIDAIDPLTGSLKNVSVLLPQVADYIKDMADGTQKAALEVALFGKAGVDLTEFLNQGSQGLADYADRLRELGGEITPEAAANADEFNDRLGDLKTAFGGIALQVASELLPDLNELIGSLVEMTTESDNGETAAQKIAEGFRVVGSVAASTATLISGITETIGGFVQAVGGYLEVAQSIWNLDANMRDKGFADIAGGGQKIGSGVGSLGQGGNKPTVVENAYDFMAGPSNYKNSEKAEFDLKVERLKKLRAEQDKLNAALNGSKTPGAHAAKAKAGKSDAERDAEKVKRAIESMTKAQQEWEDELTKTGNPIADAYAENLRDITAEGKKFAEEGVPSEKIAEFTDRMKVLATTMHDADLAKFQQEFDDQTAEMVAQMAGPAAAAMQQYTEQVRDLNKLLKDGAISQAEYNARLAELGKQKDSPMVSVNEAINEQILLLGMTNEEQEIYNNLKQAGVKADSDWGATITENTKRLQEVREQVAFMDDVKESLSGAFTDFITGAKSAKDAFGDFADHLYQTAIKFLADKAVQALFDSFNSDGSTGTATGGSSGGGWMSALMSLFGGGKAGGGTVSPGHFYEVGENNQSEIFSTGGRQYIIPGNAGSVTPMRGQNGDVNVNFMVQGRMTRETQAQAAQRVARAQRLATARNS